MHRHRRLDTVSQPRHLPLVFRARLLAEFRNVFGHDFGGVRGVGGEGCGGGGGVEEGPEPGGVVGVFFCEEWSGGVFEVGERGEGLAAGDGGGGFARVGGEGYGWCRCGCGGFGAGGEEGGVGAVLREERGGEGLGGAGFGVGGGAR